MCKTTENKGFNVVVLRFIKCLWYNITMAENVHREVPDKTYHFLLTTAKRDGINRIFIGIAVPVRDIHVGEMRLGERMDDSIRRIAKEIGFDNIKIKKYLGKFDLTADGTPIRQFNFEITANVY